MFYFNYKIHIILIALKCSSPVVYMNLPVSMISTSYLSIY